MKLANIKAQNTKSKGRFLKVKIENSQGEQSFVGKIKNVQSKYIIFHRFSQPRGEVKFHIDSIKGIS